MKSQVESVTDVKKVIHFEIPWEEVEKEIRQTVRQISRSARVPGFRPGKAPESVIRNRFANQIKDEVIRTVVPRAYDAALKEESLDVISEPALQDVMYAEGSPFLFKIAVETRPKIEVKDYKGIDLTSEKVEVTEEEIDSVLKNYQERAAELIPLSDTEAATGHHVSAKVKATLEKEGKQQKLFDDQTIIELGAEGSHPAFNENLTGKKAGNVVEFDAEYGEDYHEKALAGKKIHYTVTVESVNEKRMASIDDEFAKDLGDFSSLEDLKDKIRKDLLNVKTGQQKSRLKDEMLKILIDKNPFEVPEGLVNQETESILHKYAHNLQKHGVNLDTAKIDWKEMQSKFAGQADQNVRALLLMEAIAKTETLDVSEEDLEKSISMIADQEHRPVEAVKAELVKEKRVEQLRHRILINKTMDFLLENAKIQYT